MSDEGWFADLDENGFDTAPWAPFLQVGSCCISMRVWFGSELACEDWIRTQVIGQEMLADE